MRKIEFEFSMLGIHAILESMWENMKNTIEKLLESCFVGYTLKSDNQDKLGGFKRDIAQMGRTDEPVFCAHCDGEGVNKKKICPKCGGYGYLNPLI